MKEFISQQVRIKITVDCLLLRTESRASWHTPVSPALGRLRQKIGVHLKLAWATGEFRTSKLHGETL